MISKNKCHPEVCVRGKKVRIIFRNLEKPFYRLIFCDSSIQISTASKYKDLKVGIIHVRPQYFRHFLPSEVSTLHTELLQDPSS